ncbi:site-specific integrase [Aliarcobacter butzleri]|uniref:tyrosine-type recombinase/integrase n=1 Tax=Aliarcobacter butzleri TaxID=28197 RepID=UPI0024DE0E80|nr:site-specific integrase [Aliarcobacter butzleri]MDK2063350.1 site-specific integrase [Aliarcobacter butzleri]
MEKTKYPGVYLKEGKKDTTYYIRYKQYNETKTEKVGTKISGMTETKAKKLLDEKKLNIIKGIDTNISSLITNTVSNGLAIEKMSLNKLAELYFQKFDKLVEEERHLEKEDKRYKDENGVKREKSLYKNFWAKWSLSIVPFYKLNSSHFVKYIHEIQKETKIVRRNLQEHTLPKYSSKYILNSITLVKSIIKHTKCPHNPLDLTKKDKTESDEKLEELYKFLKDKSTPRTEYLEPHQIKLLLETLKEEEKHFQGYLITLIIATTGMRPDSCLNLKIKDLMFKDKIIKTYDFKRKMTYYCNLTPMTATEIQPLIRDRSPSEYIFFSEKTKGVEKLPRTPDYINEVISDLFNTNKYDKDRVVLYNLRHSFATNLIKGKKDSKGNWISYPVPIFTIQKLLNHSKVETTIKHYAKFSPDFAVDAVKSYEESFM